jgi:hypothetical protein
VLPVLQEGEAELNEAKLFPPLTFEANTEIFFLTCLLPQSGQVTSLAALALRNSSSKGRPQLLQTNSKMGMLTLLIRKLLLHPVLRCRSEEKVAEFVTHTPYCLIRMMI